MLSAKQHFLKLQIRKLWKKLTIKIEKFLL
jgi:hypothetical protein